MKRRTLYLSILGLIILLLVNLAGGMLIFQTFQRAKQVDQDLASQGKNIAQSIAITLQNNEFSEQSTNLQRLADELLNINDIEAITLIGVHGEVIAHSGASVPETFLAGITQKEVFGERHHGSFYISLPIMGLGYGSGLLTEEAIPEGYIALSLSTINADRQYSLLISYCISGAIALGCINLLIQIAWITFYRRRKYGAGASEQRRFKNNYRQLEHSIELQQQAMDQAREEALKASEIKSQFIANMSHEIRTPLNAVIGFTDLLLKTSLTQRQQDFLSTIRKSSSGLLQIINDILDFSKIEAGKIALNEVSTCLRDTVEDVLTVLAPAAHEKRIELIPIIYPEVPNRILADPLRLKQILTNLVSNGIKFTHKGSVVIRVTVEQKIRSQATIKISVSDTGIGIPENYQQTLFQAFSQVDTSSTRQYGGTGLGLVIAKQLVEQMNGAIGVKSQPAQGSNFWFTFQAELSDKEPSDNVITPLSGRRIAFFDMHPLARMSLGHLLNEWQTISHSVGNLNELEYVIAQAYGTSPFDAAIISLDFDDDSWDIANRIIAKLKNTYHCPTILLHNTTHEENEDAALSSKASISLTKPVRQTELHEAISLIIADPDHIANRQIPDASNRPQVFNRPPRILVVDDNPANLKLVSTLLGDINASVTPAKSGFEALDLLQRESFDLVLMDIQMPGMDGVETTRQIRNKPSAYRDIPVIALTAHALDSEKKNLLASGMDDYLTKPVSEQQLISTILEWTDIRLTRFKGHQPTEEAVVSDTTLVENTQAVDFKLGIKLAAGKEKLARELFQMLLTSLEKEQPAIQLDYQNLDHDSMLQKVHKLHGATRYCGVPALQAATAELEATLKQQQHDRIEQAITRLHLEIDSVRSWAETNAWNITSEVC